MSPARFYTVLLSATAATLMLQFFRRGGGR